MNDVKLCKNCNHFVQSFFGCKKTAYTNLVVGGEQYEPCLVVRDDDSRCGKEGKWFEPKESK